jgi:HemX protein
VDRQFLILSTICYFAAVARSVAALRARIFHHTSFNFLAITLGFGLQTVFLYLRGHAIGRCPITNLFEVLVFLAWSIALIYLLVGPAYRLSLMGSFTAPLVLFLQVIALMAPIDTTRSSRLAPNAWLEFHASISIVAYGAFALACVAGVMYLVQERQLKTHELRSIFYHLPPLPNLFSAMTRLLWFGFALYTAGLVSGFFTGEPLPRVKITLAVGIWVLYGAILVTRLLHSVAPRRLAALSVGAFAAALSLLWSIEFVANRA